MNLVLMEVGKKQNYIFKSNKLKDNIGASMIIKHITENLAIEYSNNYSGKVIMAGGGKGIFIFEKETSAKAFIKDISSKILESFRGLDIYLVTNNFDMEKDNVVDVLENLYFKLESKKATKKSSFSQVSLGIESRCASTGLPAVECVKYHELENEMEVSEEIRDKFYFYNDNIDKFFEDKSKYFKKELVKLKDEEKSFIAVIHIDGNSMGNKFSILKEYYKKLSFTGKNYNEKYLEDYKELSENIEAIYRGAFYKVIDESIENNESVIRPIIVAGDDVTFISKAKNAIKLTKLFLDEIIKSKVKIGDKEINLNAAAGIAFAKYKTPFNIMYKVSENLTANCKYHIKDKGKDMSMIDWHIIQGEMKKSIETIREEQYKGNNLNLNLRPLIINYSNKEEFRTYDVFERALEIVKNDNIPRSKIKELRSKLVEGQREATKFIEYYGLQKYFDSIVVSNEVKFTLSAGIINNRSIFFDAIEIMDIV